MEIVLDDKKVFIKRYKIRKTGQCGKSIESTIPREVFEREAKRLGYDTVDEAVTKVYAVWRYGPFPGLYLTFENRDSGETPT